jgi:nitroreductase
MLTDTTLDTLSAVRQRRAVKHYDPQFVMPQADLDQLLELAVLSPTSFNIQNWRFVVVTDPQQKQRLRQASWDQAQVTDASVVLLLCADLKSWEKQPERYFSNAPAPVRERLVPMIGQFYAGNDTLQRDEAMRSVGIAAQTVMLTAKAMGYDSCPMIGFDPVQVAEIIQLPEDHVIGMMVVVGKALQPAFGRSGQLPLADVVVHNHF